jgi:hypothetical protein
MIHQDKLFNIATELEARRWSLMQQGHTRALSGLLSDDLRFVHSSGLIDDKQSYIDSIESGTVVYKTADFHFDAVIPLGGDAFIANGVIHMSAVIRSELRQLHSIFTVVWHRDNGSWQLVAHQTTPIPA